MKYNNIYEYLDDALKHHPNPSNEEIKSAKREYWKLFYKHYRREQRKIRQEFTLGLDEDTVKLIHVKRQDLTVSQFLYQSIKQGLNNNTQPIIDSKLLKQIDHNMMQIIDKLEELHLSDSSTIIDTLLSRLEDLEEQIHSLIKTS